MTSYLVVIQYVSFVEESISLFVFLYLLHINRCVNFEALTRSLRDWKLDFDRCIGFGSNRALTMTGKGNSVATKKKTITYMNVLSGL